MKNKQKGFTLVEIVIAISLLVLIMTVVMNGLGPWLKFKQNLDTEQTLTDLKNATETLYRANAFTIMDSGQIDLTGTAIASRKMIISNASTAPVRAAVELKDSTNLGNTDISTYCSGTASNSTFQLDHPTVATGTVNVNNLAPLSPFLSKSLDKVVTDGFNNTICVYVSPSIEKLYQGFPLYYHVVAFVSPGENGRIDDNTSVSGGKTRFYQNNGEWMLETAGDDKAAVFDGLKIALDGFKISQERLQKYAKAYETYFNIRFLSKEDRDITINYFYASNGVNNGDTGNSVGGTTVSEVFLPQTKSLGAAPLTFKQLSDKRNITKLNLTTATSEAGQFNYVLESIIPDGLTDPVSFAGALGISLEDSFNAWGLPIYVDNYSPRVRSGVDTSGATPTKNQPPFSASFGTFLPGTGKVKPDTLCSALINNAGAYCPTFITATANGNY